MRKSFSILAFAALMLTVASCDKIDINNTHKPYSASGGGKTVLIKDFTGVRCVNCPAAAETAHELQHQLGADRIFIMGVHAGFLATPVGLFPDFRTEEGTAWYNNNASNPLFSVDHVALTEGNTLNESQLDAPVADALAEPQTFKILIENTYDTTARQLRVNNTFSALGNGEGKYYGTVCLLEDSIVGRQRVPSSVVAGGVDTAYVFRNVFRGTLNGADGELVSNGHYYANDEFTLNCAMTLDETYNADQCYILTYIYDYDSGKIIQTEMKKVK